MRRSLVLLAVSTAVTLAGRAHADNIAPGAQGHPMAAAPVRTDLEPLRKRFPQLGHISSSVWQCRVIGGDSLVPGPSDTLIQALVELDPADLATITGGYTWQPAPDCWSEHLSDQLRPYMPADGDWRYSQRFEADARTPLYHGSVCVEMRGGTVYLNVATS